MTVKCMIATNDITLIDGKMSSQMSMSFTNTILTLPKKVAEANLIKSVSR